MSSMSQLSMARYTYLRSGSRSYSSRRAPSSAAAAASRAMCLSPSQQPHGSAPTEHFLQLQAMQAAKKFRNMANHVEVTPEKIKALLEESHELSRGVADTLVAAARAKHSTEHLFKSWSARHNLPCETETLDPGMFPRPPPGTQREVRPVRALLTAVDTCSAQDWMSVLVTSTWPCDVAMGFVSF